MHTLHIPDSGFFLIKHLDKLSQCVRRRDETKFRLHLAVDCVSATERQFTANDVLNFASF